VTAAELIARWRPRAERAWPAVRAVGAVVSFLVVAVVAVAAVRNLRDARLDLAWLVPAAAATLVWWLGLARAWSVLAAGAASGAEMATWFRTQALRYLPGGVWAPLSRIAVAGGRPVDRVSTVTAENVISLGVALAVGGVALAVARSAAWILLVLVPVLPVAATRLTHRHTRLSRERVLGATATNLAAFLAYAGAAVLAQAAVSGSDVEVLAIAGAAAVAWAAGLVVVLSPGGIGVREVTYLALATGSVPRPEAVTGSVALRAVTVLVELAVLAVVARRRSGDRRSG
jgi:glycosyltransferase 2 family protein